MPTRLITSRSDISDIKSEELSSVELEVDQVRVAIDLFGLTSNNISYALYGDALGYWAYFPVNDTHGCVPVWGFADVIESRHPEVAVGTRLFGYLPMASETILQPGTVDDLAISDAGAHRVALHPWYNRYYQCGHDPLWSKANEPAQAAMWPLFMTGWALADQLAESVETVVVSSASSKTALSLAWALKRRPESVEVVGLTSPSNREYVAGTATYDRVVTYDDVDLADVVAPAGYVDAAGSPAITESVHLALGDRATESVILGATHQGAGEASGAAAGPPPRFFFIPDVAEQRAETEGLDAYHGEFASAWADFVPWITGLLTFEQGSGVESIQEAYRTLQAGEAEADTVTVMQW